MKMGIRKALQHLGVLGVTPLAGLRHKPWWGVGRSPTKIFIILSCFALIGISFPNVEWVGEVYAAGLKGDSVADSGKRVTMDFQNVELLQVIRFVAEMAGKNYVVDPKIKGKVTVITPNPVSLEEAERIFESILSVQGLTVIERDGAYKIIPEKEGRTETQKTLFQGSKPLTESEVVVSRLIRVNHVAANLLVTTLKPLVHQWGALSAHIPSNSLIVTDTSLTVERIATLVLAMDFPFKEAVHQLFPLQFASAVQLEKLVNAMFADYNGRKLKGDPKVQVLSDVRLNLLVVVAPQEKMEQVKGLIRKLDKPVQVGLGNLHLYYPKNGKAEVIAKVLTDLISKAQAGKTAGGGLKPVQLLRDVSVVGEKESNTLVIAAASEDYQTLLPIIQGLDLRRLQVHVEALIVEVSAERSAEFGVEWGITNNMDPNSTANTGFGGSNFGSLGTNPLATSSGLAVGIMRGWISNGGTPVPNLAALIKAVQGDSDVNVLATPNIIAMENEEAEIISGKNVPIATGTTTATNTTTTFDRKNVGLTLRITPQVVEDGWLRLKIFQEQSSLEDTVQSAQVITKNRSIQTVVMLRDGETVVLGGLISEERSGQVNQVPCLGGIIGLGELFKQTSRKRNKSNLMVFINPTIINTYSDSLNVSEKKYQQVRTFWQETERSKEEGTSIIPPLAIDPLPLRLNNPHRLNLIPQQKPIQGQPLNFKSLPNP